MASPGMQGIGNGFLEGLQLSKQMDRQENQEQRQQKRMDMAEEEHGLAIEQMRSQQAHNEKMRPLERETQELSNELTEAQINAKEQEQLREQIKRNMQMQTPAYEQALENEDYAAVGEFLSRNMTGVTNADVLNDKNGQLTLAAEGEDGQMYTMPVNDESLRQMWYKGAGLEQEEDDLTYKDGVFFNSEGEVVQDHRDRLGLNEGAGGDAPADVQTVEWMVETGVARNEEEGWRKLRQSMSNPPEQAIQDLGQTLLENNPRAYRDNPGAAMEDARSIYYEKINPGARGGSGGGAGGLDVSGGNGSVSGQGGQGGQGGSDYDPVDLARRSIEQGLDLGNQAQTNQQADASQQQDPSAQVSSGGALPDVQPPYRPGAQPQDSQDVGAAGEPEQSGLTVPAPNRPSDTTAEEDPSLTDPRQSTNPQALFEGLNPAPKGDDRFNVDSGLNAEASTPEYQYRDKPEAPDETPIIDPENSAGARYRESFNKTVDRAQVPLNPFDDRNVINQGYDQAAQGVDEVIRYITGDDEAPERSDQLISDFIKDAPEQAKPASAALYALTPTGMSELGANAARNSWDWITNFASDFFRYQQMSSEAENFWKTASEGGTPTVQDLQAAKDHMKSLEEGSPMREQQRKVLKDWLEFLKNRAPVASEQEVNDESRG